MERPLSTIRATLAATTLALFFALPATAREDQQTQPVTLSDIRGMRFCEVLLIFDDRVDIYNTSNANGCPEDKWAAMDTQSIAANHGARKVQLNGPHFWAMDQQTIGFGATKTFGGIEAGYAATLPLSALGSGKGATPYAPYTSAKDQTMIFRAGSPVYELRNAAGETYILNAYGAEVSAGDPANLATQLSPADGWTFQMRTPGEDLTIKGTTDRPVDMVGDDLHQYYTRVD